MPAKADCGFVIALQEEVDGTEVFGGFAEYFAIAPEPGAQFVPFAFQDSDSVARTGVLTIVLAMTPHPAYLATLRMIDEYQPSVVINVGIAGSLNRDAALGDVVVVPFADNYDYKAKAIPAADQSGFTFQYAGLIHRADWSLFDRVRRVRGTRTYSQWQSRSRERKVRMSADALNAIAEAGHSHESIKLLDGPIASGNTVGAATAFKRAVLNHSRDLIAVEMEAAGVLEACNSRGIRSVAIKAISDPADEGKGQLERETKDQVRSWAMSNALDLSSIVVRQLVQYDAKPSVDVRDRLLTLAERHFKKQHRDLAANIEESLKLYGALFRPIISDLPGGFAKQNLFNYFADIVANSTNAFPLRVNGKPGTGKTTFLTLLYLALYIRSKSDSSSPIPIYVNLKRYLTPGRSHDPDRDSSPTMRDDFAFLEGVLGDSSQSLFVILIDGVDEYVRYDDSIERSLFQLVQRTAASKKVVAVGLNYLADKERYRRELPQLHNPDSIVTLSALPLRDVRRVTDFIVAYRGVARLTGVAPAELVQRVGDRARAFKLGNIDLLLTSMLIQSLSSNSYAKAGRLSDFFTRYCEDFLQDGERAETLTEASQLAFDYTVKETQLDLDKCVRRRGWKLLHSHPIITDFLVAFHATQAVRAAGRGLNDSVSDLDYVYPHRVNRFCKDLANASREIQFDVLEGAKRVYSEGGSNAKPHGCYLAGRLEDHDATRNALTWLRSCKATIEQGMINGRRMLQTDLLVARTVYISLACLGDEEASEEYVRILLAREDWNDVNRGFHLEYYDDIPFEPNRLLSHHDPLLPFPNTLDSLRERIQTNINNSEYGLFNIEVFTLYSLAQHRHVNRGKLDDRTRVELLKMIPTLMAADNLTGTLRDYLAMLATNLSSKYFPVGRLAEQLYGLKTLLRAGWKERNLPLPRAESVAEHVVGAYILGLLYLPDDNPENWKGYVKSEVLSIVMAHDLAEAISGDVTPTEATEESRARERAAFRYLAMCRTYPGVSNLEHVYHQWEAFEKGSDENARIARDLDKLDNLVQLYIYREDVEINSSKQWMNTLAKALTTNAGKRVLQIIKENFEPKADL